MKTLLKLIAFVWLLFGAGTAYAGPAAEDLMHLGMPAPLADYLATSEWIQANNTYLKIASATSGNLNILKADGSDNTYLNTKAAGTLYLAVGGTGIITLGASGFTLAPFNVDANFATGKTVALQEAVAGTACSGTLTANGATPVVTSTSCATTGSRIFLSRTSAETGAVQAWVSAISNGVSFSITGEAADTGTYNWIIFHETP